MIAQMRFLLLLSLFVSCISPLRAHPAGFGGGEGYRYEVAVVARFQNEAPWMKEWIEYYRLLGVSHFYLYNHFSEDDYLSVLQPYIDAGVVSLFQWTEPSPNVEEDWKHQVRLYTDALNRARGVAKWLAVVDLDEFIVPFEEDDLPTYLKQYERYAGVVIQWLSFGTSNLDDVPEGQLMIEALVTSCPEGHENAAKKCIVQPERVFEVNVHHPSRWDRSKPGPVNTAFEPYGVPGHWKAGRTNAQVNHYKFRTWNWYKAIKHPRLVHWRHFNPNPESARRRVNACNCQTDDRILRFVEPLKARMSGGKQ